MPSQIHDSEGKPVDYSIECKIEPWKEHDQGRLEAPVVCSDENESIEKFKIIAQNFVTNMQVLWEYAHEVGAVAERTSLSNLEHLPSLLRKVVSRAAAAETQEIPVAAIVFKSDVAGTKQEVRFPVYEISQAKQISECISIHTIALRLLNETVLQQMVNAWERVVGDLVAWKFLAEPDLIPKERTLSYSRIIEMGEIREIKNYVILSEVNEFLRSNTTLEQVRYFKSNFGADLESVFAATGELC